MKGTNGIISNSKIEKAIREIREERAGEVNKLIPS